ncbi:MAG: hypothetical protein ACLGIO_13960 [Acidimicrobiia bacterium]
MGAIYDDLEGHEGYGASQPGEGATGEVLVAACRCGWTGGAHPDTEDGYDELLDDWDRHHARPLLARTLPAAVADIVAEARRALVAASAERPQAALAAAEDLARWATELADRARAAIGVPEPARRSGPAAGRRR